MPSGQPHGSFHHHITTSFFPGDYLTEEDPHGHLERFRTQVLLPLFRAGGRRGSDVKEKDFVDSLKVLRLDTHEYDVAEFGDQQFNRRGAYMIYHARIIISVEEPIFLKHIRRALQQDLPLQIGGKEYLCEGIDAASPFMPDKISAPGIDENWWVYKGAGHEIAQEAKRGDWDYPLLRWVREPGNLHDVLLLDFRFTTTSQDPARIAEWKKAMDRQHLINTKRLAHKQTSCRYKLMRDRAKIARERIGLGFAAYAESPLDLEERPTKVLVAVNLHQ